MTKFVIRESHLLRFNKQIYAYKTFDYEVFYLNNIC